MTVASTQRQDPKIEAPLEYRIGRYRIRARLGRGGMGVVYLGHDDSLDRDVAVKTLRVDGAGDEDQRGRFEIEARAAARLQHPNIVTVFELGEDRGIPFIAMELLGGDDLETLLRAGERLTPIERLDVAIQTLRGLEFAHAHRIVHRDMKPSNIRVLDDGSVKILDFGIAKLETTSVTRAGMVVGTPHYMSPEHIRGGVLDGRSDVFAVGVILHELFAGKRPFSAEDAARTMFRIVSEPHPRLGPDTAGPMTAELQGLIDRALAKDADSRFASASAMADALTRLRDRAPSPTLPAEDAAELSRLHRLGLSAVADTGAAETVERIARVHPDSPEALRALRRLRRKPLDKVAMAETARFPELDSIFGRAQSAAPPTLTSDEETIRSRTGAVTGQAALATAPGLATEPRLSDLRSNAVLYGALAAAGITGGIAIYLYLSRPASPDVVTIAPPAATTSAPGLPAAARPTPGVPTKSTTLPARPAARTVLPMAPTPALDTRRTAPPAPAQVTVAAAPPVSAPVEAPVAAAAPDATLIVDSAYPVTVTLGGRPLPPDGDATRFRAPAGTHEVIIESPAVFLKMRATVAFDAGTPARLQTPAAGKFSVRASPDNCKIFVDGVFADYPPILDHPIVAGAHAVTFEWPDGARSEQMIQIQAGKPAYVMGRRP